MALMASPLPKEPFGGSAAAPSYLKLCAIPAKFLHSKQLSCLPSSVLRGALELPYLNSVADQLLYECSRQCLITDPLGLVELALTEQVDRWLLAQRSSRDHEYRE